MNGIGRLCTDCQAQLEPGVLFCQACGRPAAAAPPPAPTRSDWILPAAPGQAGPPPGYSPSTYPSSQGQPPGPPYAGQMYEWPTEQQAAVSRPGPGPGRSGPGPAPLAPGGPPLGFPGSALPGPPPGQSPGPPRQPPRRHNANRSGSFRVLWVLLPLLVIGVAVAVLLTHPFSQSGANQPASAGTGSASPGVTASPDGTASAAGAGTASPVTGSASAAAATEQQAARQVASLLAQSVSDRAAISGAAADIGRCGPGLAGDPTVFNDAAASRKSLLASLAQLPGRGMLPAGLVSDLTAAWQASISADQAYARWASDEIAKGCTAGDTGDPGYQAAQAPDAAATTDKTTFTTAWNPVAARYDLTSYQPGQL